MGKELSIRTASAEDAAGLLEIYRPYVEHTAITFEYHEYIKTVSVSGGGKRP